MNEQAATLILASPFAALLGALVATPVALYFVYFLSFFFMGGRDKRGYGWNEAERREAGRLHVAAGSRRFIWRTSVIIWYVISAMCFAPVIVDGEMLALPGAIGFLVGTIASDVIVRRVSNPRHRGPVTARSV